MGRDRGSVGLVFMGLDWSGTIGPRSALSARVGLDLNPNPNPNPQGLVGLVGVGDVITSINVGKSSGGLFGGFAQVVRLGASLKGSFIILYCMWKEVYPIPDHQSHQSKGLAFANPLKHN